MVVDYSMNKNKIRNITALLVSIILAQGAGLLGSLATVPQIDSWYRELTKPAFTPPDGAFSIVWPLLFTLMAVAAWLVWLRRDDNGTAKTGLIWYGVQLICNVAWSFLFFGMQSPPAALVEILILLTAIIITTWYFYKVDIKAAILMTPYILWVGYAMVLNGSIVLLN